jgi:hypothetical protein
MDDLVFWQIVAIVIAALIRLALDGAAAFIGGLFL